jgi:putative ABC transport system ATP-binding protein
LQELSSKYDKTIVMVTHDAVAAAAAMRTLHLEKGQLAEQATTLKPQTV